MSADPLKYIGSPQPYSQPVYAAPPWGSTPASLAAYVISQVPGMTAEQQSWVQDRLANGQPLMVGAFGSPLSLEQQNQINQLQPFSQGATSQQAYQGPSIGPPATPPPPASTPPPPAFGPKVGGGGTVKQGGVAQPLPGPLDSLPASPTPHAIGGNVTWDEPYIPHGGDAIPYGGTHPGTSSVQPYSPSIGPGATIAESTVGTPQIAASTNYDTPISMLRLPRFRIRRLPG